nr:hypothetical protein CFP56_40543 [Quercus suber]
MSQRGSIGSLLLARLARVGRISEHALQKEGSHLRWNIHFPHFVPKPLIILRFGMLAPTSVTQTKGNKVGRPDCEALGFVFFPTYSVWCLGIAKSDAENIFLCGLHEGVLYQMPVPLIGLLVNKLYQSQKKFQQHQLAFQSLPFDPLLFIAFN